VAATAPVTAKGSGAKTAATTQADSKTSSGADASATTDPTATVAQQPAVAVKPDATGATDAANAGNATGAALATTTPAHNHAAGNTSERTATASVDASGQTAVAVPQQLASTAINSIATGPLTATAATHAVPLSGLALEIAASVKNGKSSFEIRLDPADLGRIDVRIDVDRSGQMTSHLTVEKPETLSMLQQDAPQLQRALNDAGFKTGDGGLQFSLRDQSSSGQNSGNDTNRNNAQRLVISNEDAVPVTPVGRSYGRMLGSSSGVDISV
jgi:flagellar hook-length control protein FliK